MKPPERVSDVKAGSKTREWPVRGPEGREIKAVIFDLDDTLFEQRQWLSGAYFLVGERMKESFGSEPSEVRALLLGYASRYSSASGNLFNLLLADMGIEATPDLLAGMIDAFYRFRPAHLDTFPGTVPTLKRLMRAGLKLAVITNGREEIQMEKLRALGIAEFFDLILVSGACGSGWEKPSPLMFQRAIAELCVSPDECIFIGDNPGIDFLPAKKTGIFSIRVLTGEYAQKTAAPGYDADINIPEIPGILRVITLHNP